MASKRWRVQIPHAPRRPEFMGKHVSRTSKTCFHEDRCLSSNGAEVLRAGQHTAQNAEERVQLPSAPRFAAMGTNCKCFCREDM